MYLTYFICFDKKINYNSYIQLILYSTCWFRSMNNYCRQQEQQQKQHLQSHCVVTQLLILFLTVLFQLRWCISTTHSQETCSASTSSQALLLLLLVWLLKLFYLHFDSRFHCNKICVISIIFIIFPLLHLLLLFLVWLPKLYCSYLTIDIVCHDVPMLDLFLLVSVFSVEFF